MKLRIAETLGEVMKRIPASGIIPPSEPLSDYLSQNGVAPGRRKLGQFRLALRLRQTPALYAQDGKGDAAVVHVKLFDPCGGATWYLLEWDGQDEAFGYVTGLGGCGAAEGEYGYVPLPELAHVPGRSGIGIEIDTGFRPAPLRTCRECSDRELALNHL
jgi:hypothetical protein